MSGKEISKTIILTDSPSKHKLNMSWSTSGYTVHFTTNSTVARTEAQ